VFDEQPHKEERSSPLPFWPHKSFPDLSYLTSLCKRANVTAISNLFDLNKVQKRIFDRNACLFVVNLSFYVERGTFLCETRL
jgi:hypothetical protein